MNFYKFFIKNTKKLFLFSKCNHNKVCNITCRNGLVFSNKIKLKYNLNIKNDITS